VSLHSVRTPFLWALLAAAVGGGSGAFLLTRAIGRSTISTAALGFIELPVVMFLWAAPCAVLGFSAAYFLLAARNGRGATFRAILAGFVSLAVAVPSAAYVIANLAIGRQVARVKTMNEEELNGVLASSCFGANPFVLAAVAQNPRASSSILRRIAARKEPQLHEKLWSIFNIMGSNTHGLAVMRLVARNPNVDAETIELLAHSNNGYVLADVAMSPKISEQTLRRLENSSDQVLVWTISRNPKTPVSVLTRLSQHSDEYVRSYVAANPSTAPEDLARLSTDSQFEVRRSVALNRNTPGNILQALRHDPDERIRAAFFGR
jgi:hypothetical protein